MNFHKQALNRHIVTHNKEKNFNCEVCNKSFTQKRNVKRHMLVHTRKKEHQCEVCEKKFFT